MPRETEAAAEVRMGPFKLVAMNRVYDDGVNLVFQPAEDYDPSGYAEFKVTLAEAEVFAVGCHYLAIVRPSDKREGWIVLSMKQDKSEVRIHLYLSSGGSLAWSVDVERSRTLSMARTYTVRFERLPE